MEFGYTHTQTKFYPLKNNICSFSTSTSISEVLESSVPRTVSGTGCLGDIVVSFIRVFVAYDADVEC